MHIFRIPNLGWKNQELESIIINKVICYVLFNEVNRRVKGIENREPISWDEMNNGMSVNLVREFEMLKNEGVC